MPDERSESDAVATALELLAGELRRRLSRHPAAHLLGGTRDAVELRLRLPTLQPPGWVHEARRATAEELDAALRRLLLHRRVFHPGHVYCLRCATSQCAHSSPGRCGEVFAGYSPSGVPRFLDLGQWLLEQHDPRVHQLYRSPPALVAHVTPGELLTRHLLPAFQDRDSGYHIHGQVATGWYRFPDAGGLRQSVALTFQIVSTRPAQDRLRFGLNLIGAGPEGEPLEHLFDRVGEIPWLEAARWSQHILTQVERSTRRRPEPSNLQLERRLHGLLNGLARRLERRQRAEERKTRHARQRHRQPTRPTWKALADLHRARDEQVLYDVRRNTLVVLGERGRAHVFNPAGRLVTSIRYSSASIDRRRKRGLWRPASGEQITALRQLATASPEELGEEPRK